MPKVLYVANKYDYAKPERGYGFEHYNFYGALANMPNVQIIYFPHERILEVGKKAMNVELRKLVDTEKPDILFAFLFTDELDMEVIGDISNNTSCKTVAWFSDDHWRFENYSKYWAKYFNWVVTTDAAAVQKYHHLGCNNVILSQWACNHALYKPVDVPKKYDVTFIGQPHGNRKSIIRALQEAGIAVECWGGGWPNGRVSQERMISIFSESKINLNLTKVAGGVDTKSFARVFFKKTNRGIAMHHPRFWVDNMRSFLGMGKEQIKGRNFEIPGCKAFLLTASAPHLEDYYQDGKEIAIFKDTQDLVQKITYYLKHEKEREQIALAGYHRTLRDHTYQIRLDRIFSTISNYIK